MFDKRHVNNLKKYIFVNWMILTLLTSKTSNSIISRIGFVVSISNLKIVQENLYN